MDNQTLLKGISIQLLPFEAKHWGDIARYFYDKDYSAMFRQYNRMLTEEDCKIYDKVIGGEVFMIHTLKDNSVIGVIQITPCNKRNKGGTIGLIVDKAFQGKHIPHEVIMIFLDYCFNRQGYNKVIVEILESNEHLKRALEKTGWYKEGKLLQECFIDGKFQNELRYSMSAYYFNKNKDKFLQEYKVWVAQVETKV